MNLLNKFIENGCRPIQDKKGQETTFKLTATGAIEAIKSRAKPSHVISVLTGLGSTQSAGGLLEGMSLKFPFPKPVELVSYLLSMVEPEQDEDFIVLDSFAGTGTTAHAALKLNNRPSKGRRCFILIETMEYAETTTAERIRQSITGYFDGSQQIPGLGGSFDFYTVGERLLQEDGMLNAAAGLSAIRDYVAWTEGIPIGQCAPLLPVASEGNASSPYWLGEAHGLGLFFVWNDTTATTLDLALLTQLVKQPGRYLIYADQCALGEDFMRRHGITYKKIPRDITRL